MVHANRHFEVRHHIGELLAFALIGLAFMAADGEHTIGEFVQHMGSQYEGGTPPGLREQIHGIVNELAAEGILVSPSLDRFQAQAKGVHS